VVFLNSVLLQDPLVSVGMMLQLKLGVILPTFQFCMEIKDIQHGDSRFNLKTHTYWFTPSVLQLWYIPQCFLSGYITTEYPWLCQISACALVSHTIISTEIDCIFPNHVEVFLVNNAV